MYLCTTLYVFSRTYLYPLMYVLRYVFLSVSGHILFVSACIPVRICTYRSPYLHVSQFVSARIPVLICTYLSPCLTVYQYGSVRISCVSRPGFVSARAMFVSASAIQCTFGQTSAPQASQITTHTHTQPPTHGDAPTFTVLPFSYACA